ncbi:MAG: response regulator transcription factor [Proteobacteria bacterium]|nr:response regulator transcription factor [Pseudomonadota bacterium]
MNAVPASVHRVGILEDDPDLRLYLEQIVGESAELALAFSAGSVAEAVARSAAARPDLCLVDLQLPDGSGLDFIAALKATASPARCLILTVLGDRESVLAALRSGADGYLLKDTPPEPLRRAMLATLVGETPLSPRAAAYLLEIWRSTPAAAKLPSDAALTAREIEVLGLFSRGLSYREAAASLGISAHTVGDHVKAIYRKLDVHSCTEAIFEARQLGLMTPRN